MCLLCVSVSGVSLVGGSEGFGFWGGWAQGEQVVLGRGEFGFWNAWLMMGWRLERDSRKDEAVVIFFIFATAGLLGWAAVKPWVDKCVQVSLRSPLL